MYIHDARQVVQSVAKVVLDDFKENVVVMVLGLVDVLCMDVDENKIRRVESWIYTLGMQSRSHLKRVVMQNVYHRVHYFEMISAALMSA